SPSLTLAWQDLFIKRPADSLSSIRWRRGDRFRSYGEKLRAPPGSSATAGLRFSKTVLISAHMTNPTAGKLVTLARIDGRSAEELRPIRFQNHIAPNATGSTLIEW